MYITGQTDKPNYENLVINGSQVLSQLPYKTYSQWMAHSEMQRNPDPCYLDFAKTPKWGYVVGIEQEALLDAYLSSKDESIINYLKQYPAKMIDERVISQVMSIQLSTSTIPVRRVSSCV